MSLCCRLLGSCLTWKPYHVFEGFLKGRKKKAIYKVPQILHSSGCFCSRQRFLRVNSSPQVKLLWCTDNILKAPVSVSAWQPLRGLLRILAPAETVCAFTCGNPQCKSWPAPPRPSAQTHCSSMLYSPSVQFLEVLNTCNSNWLHPKSYWLTLKMCPSGWNRYVLFHVNICLSKVLRNCDQLK